jgi:hypothetical protein
MQIRLYFDEDASARAVAHNLRVRGVDVTTTQEEGRRGISDLEQLEYATQQQDWFSRCGVGADSIALCPFTLLPHTL